MACEDFPCCGHEAGCCPDFDEAGNQLNMRCTCGAVLPVHSRFSICDSCLDRGSEYEDNEPVYDPYMDDRDEQDDAGPYEPAEDAHLDGMREE